MPMWVGQEPQLPTLQEMVVATTAPGPRHKRLSEATVPDLAATGTPTTLSSKANRTINRGLTALQATETTNTSQAMTSS